jgi:hypothetical protein
VASTSRRSHQPVGGDQRQSTSHQEEGQEARHSGEQTITTEKSYKGTLQFSNIHTSLKVLVFTAGHLILGSIEELEALAKEADHEVLPELLDKTNQVGRYLKRSGIIDDGYLYLHTPLELLEHDYHFMEVSDSAGRWAKWKVFKGNHPRLVILTSSVDTPADGFGIHHSPSLVITPPSSETSESESESICTTSSSEPPDLISDSYEAPEDSDD